MSLFCKNDREKIEELEAKIAEMEMQKTILMRIVSSLFSILNKNHLPMEIGYRLIVNAAIKYFEGKINEDSLDDFKNRVVDIMLELEIRKKESENDNTQT